MLLATAPSMSVTMYVTEDSEVPYPFYNLTPYFCAVICLFPIEASSDF